MAFHIPMNGIFPDWNVKARMEYSQKHNGVDFITLRGGLANMMWEISYKQLRLLFCHIAFTYAVIYYILPLYISAEKKWISTTLKLVLIFIAFLALHYYVTWRNLIDGAAEWAHRGIPIKPPTPAATITPAGIILMVGKHIIFNLSTLLGVAVAIKLLKRWWLKQKETELVAKEKLTAELQLLKAQIHPHFLFNSLNNIYSFALEGSPRAPEMIQKLSGLLHYMLYGCKQPLVPLEKELKMIQDYISLEKIRYGERLKMDFKIKQDSHHHMIAPLLLIPFVENSFKHGTSKMLSRPYVNLNITVSENILYLNITNSRASEFEEISISGNRGLGLKNVKKRLALLYPGQHELQTMDDAGSYTVWLKILLSVPLMSGVNIPVKEEMRDYELA